MTEPATLEAATQRIIQQLEASYADRVMAGLEANKDLPGGAQILGMGIFSDAIRGSNRPAILATYQHPQDVVALETLANMAPDGLAELARIQLHAGSGIPEWMSQVAESLKAQQPKDEKAGLMKRMFGGA